MTEWRHLCLMAINITTKLTNQFTGTRPMHLTDNISSLDPDDDFRLVVEMSVTTADKDYPNPHDQTTRSHVTPEFKPFNVYLKVYIMVS